MPPPLDDDHELFEILLFRTCGDAAPPMEIPPPPTPPLYPLVWPLFLMTLPWINGEPKLTEMPPPPSAALLLMMKFPVIVGEEFAMRIPPPSRAELAALPLRTVKPLSTD